MEKKRILVVDDDPLTLRMVSRVLEREGYDVRPTKNAEEALQQCKADPPDLLISDIRMPGLDGYGLIETLRSDKRLVTVPVVFLSGAGDEAGEKCRRLGAEDFLAKPISAASLLAAVAGKLKRAAELAQAATSAGHAGTRPRHGLRVKADGPLVETGIEVLDRHVGGFYVGPSYLLKGEPGTAKGLLAIEFLYRGLEAGQGAVLVSTERPENVLLVAESIGLSLGKFVAEESLIILETIPEFEKILVSAEDIPLMVSEIRSYCAKAQAKRLVINSISSLIDLAYRMTFSPGHVQTFIRNLDSLGIITLLVSDSLAGGELWEAFERAVFGVLRTGRDTHTGKRYLTFEKMKGTQVPQEPVEFGVEYGTGLILCGGAVPDAAAILRLKEVAARVAPQCRVALVRRQEGRFRLLRAVAGALRDLVSAAIGACDRFQLLMLKVEAGGEIRGESLVESLLPVQAGDVICWKRPGEMIVMNTGLSESGLSLQLKIGERLKQLEEEVADGVKVFLGWAIWPAEAKSAEGLIEQALARLSQHPVAAGRPQGAGTRSKEGQ